MAQTSATLPRQEVKSAISAVEASNLWFVDKEVGLMLVVGCHGVYLMVGQHRVTKGPFGKTIEKRLEQAWLYFELDMGFLREPERGAETGIGTPGWASVCWPCCCDLCRCRAHFAIPMES